MADREGAAPGAADEGKASAPRRRRYVRFTRWRRRRFFEMLAETGHVQMAAEAAGISFHAIYRLRRVEPGFAEKMAAAREEASRRLGRREAGEGLEGCLVVRRGIGGRLRVMAAGRRWWTGRHDALFLAHLRASGNISAAARAAGFTPKSAWNRRDRLAGFALAWDEAMEDAEIGLEFRLVVEAGRMPASADGVEPGRGPDFDPWQAMRILTWRERKRQGRHRAPAWKRQSTIEEVTESIVRNVEAIQRHQARFGDGSAGGGERPRPLAPKPVERLSSADAAAPSHARTPCPQGRADDHRA